ncbi:valine--tRNA ligase [Aliifodinibius sp. S!AR15-10]|uniref:valine--tRNA ligase n=1 Tax=Aliifodinibius sp. S!AR15-10 TaxID=2950437 RepID=UPI002858487D|nr:valine--tRNA ligase [Aliifodinibius sp. S!AR15-10]MDR8390184.1 valine--tRNA ligase [Aliifodinibius sp. S!AR15-10]
MSTSPALQDIPKKYDPSKAEDKWYKFWNDSGFFHSEPDERESYTIVIPPPNVTGVLHMGHMLNNTIQDVLVRRARMQGYNACWVPGTDHASIATEAKVVNKLREEGITKADLTREEFLEHAWDWTHEHGGIILEQLKKLGASCDWERTRFTLEDDLYESVIDCFIELYERGYIYRGKRMINWDPEAQTALSDEEVIHREKQSKLYHVKYDIAGEDANVVIATTRPETILADTAVCVNPDDERYQDLIGKQAIIPMVERKVPIIADEYVDPEYGTGCLKITPAHDENDYQIGQKHELEIIDMLNRDGTLNEDARFYVGQDRFEARKSILKDLEQQERIVKVEEMSNKIGYSERTDTVIEPRLSLQWFCSMDKMAKPALENVMNDNVQFHPAKFKNSYRHWMENIRDWCISRQLWWGQRIPAWYFGEGAEEYVIAKTEDEALEKAREKSGRDLTKEDIHQDVDVLDTWFSSWLWPITVFDGIRNPDNEEINYYYPTNDLVTAPEIMFFWVARMIMSGYEFRGEKPFSNVYYTGIVRDSQRRKMSKSLGNSPDPLDLIDQYGADGVRVGMLFTSPAGNDLLFEENLCEQGRNFANKIWNAFRFLAMNMEESQDYSTKLKIDEDNLVDRWMLAKVHSTIKGIEEDFRKFRINEALKKIYSLIWDDFCDWYIELIKSDEQGANIPKERLERGLSIFEVLLKLLHPFMPFLTEEIWQLMRERKQDEAIIVAQWPAANEELIKDEDIALFASIQSMISSIRNIRAEFNVPQRADIALLIKAKNEDLVDSFQQNEWIFRKLQDIGSFEVAVDLEQPEASASAVVEGSEIFVPLEGLIDLEKERERIEKEINRLEGFLKSVNGKLNNEQFVENAPEDVVQRERDKKEDTETNLDKLRGILGELS